MAQCVRHIIFMEDPMQTISGKQLFKAEAYENIRDLVFDTRNNHGTRDAFVYRKNPTEAEIHKTYNDFVGDVEYLGTSLFERGMDDAHLAVIGENSYEWMLSYASILSCGAVGIPLDRLLPEQEVASLLKRGHVTALFYHPRLHDMVTSIARNADDQFPTKLFICMDKARVKWDFPQDTNFIDINELLDLGKQLWEKGDRRLMNKEIDPEAVKIILFTSGTTATSKGVMLAHKNICQNVYRISMTLRLNPGERAFSILPLHHTFENTCDLFLMSRGVALCFSDGLRYLLKNFQEWHIEIVIAVPLLFENIHKKLIEGIEEAGKSGLINAAIPVTRFLRKLRIDIRRHVFKDLLDKLGGHLRLVVIGGAGIDKEIIQTFNDFGVLFLMGYGLTETSPVISTTTHEKNIYGSIGPPMAGIEVAIDTDSTKPGTVGEVLTRSECVMKGYYENPEATEEVFTNEGWFRTGDMGYLDKHGCIHLTGRVKSMIVLTNGKKAFPEEIETLLNNIPGVKESFVWGEDKYDNAVEICAKIQIDRQEIGQYLPIPEKTPGDIAISSYLKLQIKDVNRQMPSFKAVHFYLFTESDMIKTTTLKIRRIQEREMIREILERTENTPKTANGQNLDTL